MSQTKHSPFPWRECEKAGYAGLILDANGEPIAQVYDNPDTGNEAPEDAPSDHNLALILAVPELLKAAEKAVDIMERAKRLLIATGLTMEEGTISAPYADSIAALRAAIAKAKLPETSNIEPSTLNQSKGGSNER